MNKIRELRKNLGLTQADLAKILNVSDRSVGFYETGERDPDTNTLKKLADYFNVSIDYLLGFSEGNKEKSVNLDEKYPPVTDVEEAMKVIMSQQGLMLKGELLTDEDKIILANSIQNGFKLAEELRKKRKEKMEDK